MPLKEPSSTAGHTATSSSRLRFLGNGSGSVVEIGDPPVRSQLAGGQLSRMTIALMELIYLAERSSDTGSGTDPTIPQPAIGD